MRKLLPNYCEINAALQCYSRRRGAATFEIAAKLSHLLERTRAARSGTENLWQIYGFWGGKKEIVEKVLAQEGYDAFSLR